MTDASVRANSVVPYCTCQKVSGPLDDFGKVDPCCSLHGTAEEPAPPELRQRVLDAIPIEQQAIIEEQHAEIKRLRVDLADSQANALSEAQVAENLQDEVIRLRRALMEIRHYPKGWENRTGICDFIDEVVPLDARP